MEKKGESGGRKSLASENIFVGNFWIKGLSKAKAGNLILLNLELDVNDILKVTAKEKATGLARTVTMDTANKGTGANLENPGLLTLFEKHRKIMKPAPDA
jgi:molecular chaperone DnaK (HSP70)